MKINVSNLPALKKIAYISITGLIVISTCFSSCKKKEDEPEPEKVITTDDAADVVVYAMESGSGGYAEQVTDGATYTDNSGYRQSSLNSSMTLSCGVAFDTTVTRSHSGTVTASYTHQRRYLLNCDTNSQATSITYSGSYTGNFDGPRMNSSNNGNRNWIITGLDSSSTVYTYSGSLTRNGTHNSEVRNQYSFTSNLQVNTSNLTVDKTTHKITGGSGSVNLSCAVSNGNTYNFSGTIVFNNNNTATLTINGNTYTINLY